MGTFNLMHQYVRESNIKNKEAVISALSQYLKGINTDGKREFLSDHSGLDFLKGALLESQGQVRLLKKLTFLILDLV
jgi:hypothetical protein